MEWSAGSLAVYLLTSAGLGTNAVGGTEPWKLRVQTLAGRRNVSRALRYSDTLFRAGRGNPSTIVYANNRKGLNPPL